MMDRSREPPGCPVSFFVLNEWPKLDVSTLEEPPECSVVLDESEGGASGNSWQLLELSGGSIGMTAMCRTCRTVL